MKGYIKNRSTGLVMGIDANERNRGGQIVTWSQHDAEVEWDKVWEFTDDGFIQNSNTGLVMGIAGNNREIGGSIVTWSKDGNWDKQWSLTPDGYITNGSTGKVMGISGNNDGRGAHIVTWFKDGNWDKKWDFEPLNIVIESIAWKIIGYLPAGRTTSEEVVVGRTDVSSTTITNSSTFKASFEASASFKAFNVGVTSSVEASRMAEAMSSAELSSQRKTTETWNAFDENKAIWGLTILGEYGLAAVAFSTPLYTPLPLPRFCRLARFQLRPPQVQRHHHPRRCATCSDGRVRNLVLK